MDFCLLFSLASLHLIQLDPTHLQSTLLIIILILQPLNTPLQFLITLNHFLHFLLPPL